MKGPVGMTAVWDMELHALADPGHARSMRRFFKSGPGEYAENDRFLGIRVPAVRALVARYHREIGISAIRALLCSPYHEKRLFALLLMVRRFRAGRSRRQIFELYLAGTRHINNWDLVDVSAPHIAGAYLQDRSRRPLYQLAASDFLWERRIAMVATLHYIRQGEAATALDIAEMLLRDEHHLIHKAAGWMLREVGKRCGREIEETFLRRHCRDMPRTMLRYAIEGFAEPRRRAFLNSTP